MFGGNARIFGNQMTIMPRTDCVTSELLFGLSEMVDHSPSSMFARTSAMRLFAFSENEKNLKTRHFHDPGAVETGSQRE